MFRRLLDDHFQNQFGGELRQHAVQDVRQVQRPRFSPIHVVDEYVVRFRRAVDAACLEDRFLQAFDRRVDAR
jgi:hypothetical protein